MSKVAHVNKLDYHDKTSKFSDVTFLSTSRAVCGKGKIAWYPLLVHMSSVATWTFFSSHTELGNEVQGVSSVPSNHFQFQELLSQGEEG